MVIIFRKYLATQPEALDSTLPLLTPHAFGSHGRDLPKSPLKRQSAAKSIVSWQTPPAVSLGSSQYLSWGYSLAACSQWMNLTMSAQSEIPCWRILGLELSHGLVKMFSELHQNLSLLLPNHPSFLLSFHRYQTFIIVWRLSRPTSVPSPLYLL